MLHSLVLDVPKVLLWWLRQSYFGGYVSENASSHLKSNRTGSGSAIKNLTEIWYLEMVN